MWLSTSSNLKLPSSWAHFAEINRLTISPPHKRLNRLADLQHGSSGEGVSPSRPRTQPPEIRLTHAVLKGHDKSGVCFDGMPMGQVRSSV